MGGYNEYVGVHYGRKSTQEGRCCLRSTGVFFFSFNFCVTAAQRSSKWDCKDIRCLQNLSFSFVFIGLQTLKHIVRCAVRLFVCLCYVILQFELPKQLDYPCLPCVSAAHALPMFREARQRSTRKQLEKDRLDPKKSHKPEPPVSGPGNVHSFSFLLFTVQNMIYETKIDKLKQKKIHDKCCHKYKSSNKSCCYSPSVVFETY